MNTRLGVENVMAATAAAQEVVFSLRREIAKIEGTLADRLDAPAESGGADSMVLRRNGVPNAGPDLLRTGVVGLDSALGGGLPRAALTEIHGRETRDAGTAAGFVLALAGLASKETAIQSPVLWIGTTEIFREAGRPYPAGLVQAFGIEPEDLLFAEAPKLLDALWVAEEAGRLTALSAVILELRGNPERLDLTATRRLHRRAIAAGRPIFLVRQSAWAEPTAAPVRLVVSPAPAAKRRTLAGGLQDSVGNPAFSVSIGKSRAALPGQFVLEWNSHDLAFQERKPAHSRRLVSLSRHGADLAAASRPVVAFESPTENAAIGGQPPREQHAKDRGARRAG